MKQANVEARREGARKKGETLEEGRKETEGGRTFAVSTCQLWNSLSLELRNEVSLESFKNNYRNILIKEQQELLVSVTIPCYPL